jgi:hypothetical protein
MAFGVVVLFFLDLRKVSEIRSIRCAREVARSPAGISATLPASASAPQVACVPASSTIEATSARTFWGSDRPSGGSSCRGSGAARSLTTLRELLRWSSRRGWVCGTIGAFNTIAGPLQWLLLPDQSRFAWFLRSFFCRYRVKLLQTIRVNRTIPFDHRGGRIRTFSKEQGMFWLVALEICAIQK